MKFQKVRVSEEELNLLRKISGVVVRPEERNTYQRHDSSGVSPMIRLIGDGVLVPVRLPEDVDTLAILLSILLGIDITDPLQTPLALTELLQKLVHQELRLVV